LRARNGFTNKIPKIEAGFEACFNVMHVWESNEPSAIGNNENIETGAQRIFLHSICLSTPFLGKLGINHFCSSSSFNRRRTIFWFFDLHWA